MYGGQQDLLVWLSCRLQQTKNSIHYRQPVTPCLARYHMDSVTSAFLDVTQCTELFIHIRGRKCCLHVCVCGWMLTRVAQIITNAHRDLHAKN